MRLRLTALGCALTGTIGLLALPSATALAENTVPAGNTVLARNTVPARTLRVESPAHAVPAKVTLTPWRMSTAIHGADVVNPGGLMLAQAPVTGDAPAKPARASVRGSAARVRTQISLDYPVTDNPYGARVTLVVTLGRTFSGRKVSLYAKPNGQPLRLVATGDVNAERKWYPAYSITRTTTFTAVFAGDAHNRPSSASRTLYVYARVASRLTGYFKTSESGGIVYDVFHGNDTLTLYSKVAPNKHGECLELETQQYDAGAGWHADTKYGCDTLDGASHDTDPFSLSQAVGASYRIRADYFRSSRDTTNLDRQGPWLYFIVTD